jgi:hypothetical protein
VDAADELLVDSEEDSEEPCLVRHGRKKKRNFARHRRTAVASRLGRGEDSKKPRKKNLVFVERGRGRGTLPDAADRIARRGRGDSEEEPLLLSDAEDEAETGCRNG